MNSKKTLSKSQYIKGLQCPKALWYYRHRKDLAPEIDAATQARFDAGNEVGELATKCFPGGKEVTSEFWNIDGGVAMTQEFIEGGCQAIFEATAVHPGDGTSARIDILRRVDGTDEWDLIEVKSSTSVKDYHIDDMSVQYHVFTGAGYKVRQCLMMVIDNSYVRDGDIDPQKLFKLEDITELVQMKQPGIPMKIEELCNVLQSADEPAIEIGPQCSKPFDCDYRPHCWKDVPEYSIFNVFGGQKAQEVHKLIGSYDIMDLPDELFPDTRAGDDAASWQTGLSHSYPKKIEEFLSQLRYPLYFLDYETIGQALPLFDGTRPYQQVPFQFSLHIQHQPGGELEHHEFLHKEQSDPRRAFAEALVEACGDKGSVIVYNQGFEMTRNAELAEAFPEYAEQINAINARMVDLLVPFRNRMLYHPNQCGSASIKAVLPAFTDLKYSGLEISDGQQAMDSYLAFMKGQMSKADEDDLWQALSKYCELDTYAMVELLGVLKSEAR